MANDFYHNRRRRKSYQKLFKNKKIRYEDVLDYEIQIAEEMKQKLY